MRSHIKIVQRCPYCPPGKGVIAVDLSQLLLDRANGPEDEDFNLEEDLNQRQVIFDPDGVANQPCPHMISLYLDGDVRSMDMVRACRNGTMDPKDFKSRYMFSSGWDHPWFKQNDIDRSINIFIWEELNDPTYRGFWPGTRFKFKRTSWDYLVPGTQRKISLMGEFIRAVDPEAFLKQLPECFERFQKFLTSQPG